MSLPLVLLPGMMCDARLYAPQIEALSSDYALHVAPIGGYDTVQALANEILANAPPRFALAGLSMGGIVAMEILRRAPDRITRLALMDTNPLAETPQVAAAREPQIVKVRTGQMLDVMREEMKPHYLAPGPYRNEIMDLVMDMADALGPEVFIRQSRALQRRRDQQGTLRKCKVPTLILCGAHDALCPVKRHTFMAELIHGAELRVLEHAGHLPTLEMPDETTQALRDWMKQPLILR